MTTVNPTSALITQLNQSNSSLGSSGSTSPSQILGNGLSGVTNTSATAMQNNFMTLLITQLQNQNPMNPMDSGQMTSQLAQISTVSGISQLNKTLTALNTSLSGSQSMAAATSLIGHTVLVPGNTLQLTSGSPANAGVTLPQAVSNLTVTIKDSAGTVLNTLNLGAQPAGVVPITWNGLDKTGAQVPSGSYQIVASATQGGASVTATPLSSGKVNSVTMGSQGASLDLGTLGSFNLSSVAYIQ
ncbi:flagellar hook assembly protein FlgD [Ferrovum sp.]|jgi:flagellar basal-body rod modification protein FlgD|uniref:flagellar hook assembly protein FlgD n=1 Tax=Ferrovum sp. TaxID=2609467 RepID=UPI002613BA27|nr:flagellar hook assembly protein FlgD [Ferrovum sp.]